MKQTNHFVCGIEKMYYALRLFKRKGAMCPPPLRLLGFIQFAYHASIVITYKLKKVPRKHKYTLSSLRMVCQNFLKLSQNEKVVLQSYPIRQWGRSLFIRGTQT